VRGSPLQQKTLTRVKGAQWMEHADCVARAAAGAPGFAAAAGVGGATTGRRACFGFGFLLFSSPF